MKALERRPSKEKDIFQVKLEEKRRAEKPQSDNQITWRER
jgi:hypothetical protein